MEPAPHLLIVDDDDRIRGLLQKYLLRSGYLVSVAPGAEAAKRLVAGLEFDLIVLDVMMPGQDGLSLTREWRGRLGTPILMLTAKGESQHRIEGLEAGADDYLVKPFEPKELLLRIQAILRRVPEARPTEILPKMLTLGPCRYDVQRGELWQGEVPVRLTATEVQLMRLFAASPGQALARERLAGGGGLPGDVRAVDVQITRLRRKIETDPKAPRYLQTVRGAGYMLVPD